MWMSTELAGWTAFPRCIDFMVIITPSLEDKQLARAEAKRMGVLHGSFSKGGGNAIGAMGEILVHNRTGGSRVGDINFNYDIVLPDGRTVDVKTTKATAVPEPYYTARVYGSEKAKEKLSTKCDVYYFVRCNSQLTLATIVGWMPAREFIERATFLPRGNVDPSDGKISFADEYTLPISELLSPDVPIAP